jgi:hypothetical protein
MPYLDLRQYRSEDFEKEILIILQSIGAPLNHTDLFVEAFDEAQRDLVFGEAVRCNPLPAPVDHRSGLLEGLQVLPLVGRAPVLEELPGPAPAGSR